MKKIFALILCLLIIFTLFGCRKTVASGGKERALHDGVFAEIENYSTCGGILLVYDINTRVVYYYDGSGYFISPYLILDGGALCGAVFEDGKIIPVTFAFSPIN